MWSVDSYLDRLYDEAIGRHRTEAASLNAEERKRVLRQTLERLIGSYEPETAYQPVQLEHECCDGYVRERVELSATPGLSYGAYVLIPETSKDNKGKRLPAVIAVHGHGYGSREIVGLKPDGSPDPEEPGIHQHFAIQLVKRGMVVIAPDIVGFGERRMAADLADNPEAPSSCYRMSTQLLMHGKTLTGLRTAEIRRTLDYISRRPEMDEQRIGIMGFSGGGLLAFTCAALDKRIRAVVLAGYPNTFKQSIMAVHHCICNFTPQMLQYAELPEWIGLISPRPLFLESGVDDPIFPAAGFLAAAEQLRGIYRHDRAEKALQTDLFPGKHEISGRLAYDSLARQLKV